MAASRTRPCGFRALSPLWQKPRTWLRQAQVFAFSPARGEIWRASLAPRFLSKAGLSVPSLSFAPLADGPLSLTTCRPVPATAPARGIREHVVDFVERPLAAAGRPAGAHRRKVFASIETEIAFGAPASKTFRLAVEIVQRAFEPGEPAAEAGGVDRVVRRGTAAGMGRGSEIPITLMRGKDFGPGVWAGGRRNACAGRAAGRAAMAGTYCDVPVVVVVVACLRRPGATTTTTRSRAAITIRRRTADSAARRMRRTWLWRWRGKVAAISPSASPAKANSTSTMRSSASRLRAIAIGQFTMSLLLHALRAGRMMREVGRRWITFSRRKRFRRVFHLERMKHQGGHPVLSRG